MAFDQQYIKNMIRSPSRFTVALVIFINVLVLFYVARFFWSMPETAESEHTYVFVNNAVDANNNKTGQALGLRVEAEEIMQQLHDISREELSPEAVQKFPVAIAAGMNFFKESRNAVESVQKYLPGRHIVFYDLGIKMEDKEKVLQWCNVTYKYLDLDAINVMHIKDLSNFAYKVFVFHDMLMSYEAFLWLDPTVHLDSCIQRQVDRIIEFTTKSGIALFDHKQHSIFSVTHPIVFNSLPSNLVSLQKTDSYGTGIMMVSRKKDIVERVLQWLLLCSLNRACIIPFGHHPFCGYSIQKPYTREINENSQGCHLYDQAIINVLLANQFTFETSAYTFPGDICFGVTEKGVKNDVKYC